MGTIFPIAQLSGTWPEVKISLSKTAYFDNIIFKVLLRYSFKIIYMPHALFDFKPFISWLLFSSVILLLRKVSTLLSVWFNSPLLSTSSSFTMLFISLKCLNNESSEAAQFDFFVSLALIIVQYSLGLVNFRFLISFIFLLYCVIFSIDFYIQYLLVAG